MRSFKKNLFAAWFGVFTTSMGLSQLAPILALYIRELGVSEYHKIAFYSGLALGITSLFMAVFSPLWGLLSDRFGCKIMLLRASFGMCILTLLLAFVQNVEQLIILRALTGLVSGFIATAIVFIALIAPKEKATYALATLSTASVSGNLIGPLFGGLFSEFLGIRALFVCIAFLLFCAFLIIYFFIDEKRKTKNTSHNLNHSLKTNMSLILSLFALTFIIQIGFNGVIPIMTLFVEQLHHSKSYIAFYTGLVLAASGISNLFFAQKLGKIADKIGASKILFIALLSSALLFYLQALAQNIIMLIFLRLLLGLSLGGLLPCINALFKKNVASTKLGFVFGFNQSAFALGNFVGAFSGGYLAGQFSIEFVFISVCLLFLIFALLFGFIQRKSIFI